jgi:uncharacterized phiE125 gp8 family phage protein
MSTTTISKTFKVDDVATDPGTSITIEVTNADGGAEVVAAGTAMTKAATGVYYTTFTDPSADLTYDYTITITHLGEVYVFEGQQEGSIDAEVVTLTEAKLHLRVDHTDEDALISSLISAAKNYCETFTNRTFLTTTKYKFYTMWPSTMYLHGPPLVSVTSIQYVDTAGSTQTFAAASYTVDIVEEPGQVYLAYGETWPSVRGDQSGITVTYVAGYGDSTDVPDGIKEAMLMLIGHWYEHREGVSEFRAGMQEVPLAVKSLLYAYKVPEVP